MQLYNVSKEPLLLTSAKVKQGVDATRSEFIKVEKMENFKFTLVCFQMGWTKQLHELLTKIQEKVAMEGGLFLKIEKKI